MSQRLLHRYRVTENPLKTERRVELAVVVLLALLALFLVLGLLRQSLLSGPEPLLPAPDSLAIQPLKLEPPLTAEAAAELLARPLFWEGRRPLAPVVAAVGKPKKKAPAKLEGVTLHGVYGEDESLGLIATVDGKLGRISKGSSVKGWQLAGYSDGVAEFVSGGRRATLPLELTTPSVKVAEAPPPTAPPPEGAIEAASRQAMQQAQKPGMQRPKPSRPPQQQGGGLTFGGGGSNSRVDK